MMESSNEDVAEKTEGKVEGDVPRALGDFGPKTFFSLLSKEEGGRGIPVLDFGVGRECP